MSDMQRVAIYTTSDGEEVAVQVAEPVVADGAGERVDSGVTFRGGGLVERTSQSLDEALARTRPAVLSLIRQLREHDDAPDELEVEFGIQLSLEVGAFIASADSSANFRVRMRWGRTGSFEPE